VPSRISRKWALPSYAKCLELHGNKRPSIILRRLYKNGGTQ
jgi:hypothetical protein